MQHYTWKPKLSSLGPQLSVRRSLSWELYGSVYSVRLDRLMVSPSHNTITAIVRTVPNRNEKGTQGVWSSLNSTKIR